MTKTWVQITSVYPAEKQIQGELRDGGKIMVSVFDVAPAFRWPTEGEFWSVERDAQDSNQWVLCGRIHVNGSTITAMEPGELRLDSENITDSLGRQLAVQGAPVLIENVYVQAEEPTGVVGPYLWVQTGEEPNDVTLWFGNGS